MIRLFQTTLKFCVIATGVLMANNSVSQPALSLDPNFKPLISRSGGSLQTAGVQPDGKILISGTFHFINGVPAHGLTRLHPDGSVDTHFRAASGTRDLLLVQPDGRILTRGASGIARLDREGQLDLTFAPRLARGPFAAEATTVTLQADQKLIVAGRFDRVNGVPRHEIARLNADGTLDDAFDAAGQVCCISALAMQADGKLLVGGVAPNLAGLARLNSDGTFDPSFALKLGPSLFHRISEIKVESDGKILIQGDFTSVSGIARNGVARLMADGDLDLGFDPPTGNAGLRVSLPEGANARLEVVGSISRLAMQPDGKVLVGGDFDRVNGIERSGLARIDRDGRLDDGFKADAAALLAVQADGKILVGRADGIWRLHSTGMTDPSFAPVQSDIDFEELDRVAVTAIVQSDGKTVLGRGFSKINGVEVPGLARINPDGTLDANFKPQADLSYGSVAAMVIQTDGRILAAGYFALRGESEVRSLLRLSSDGKVDSGFKLPESVVSLMHIVEPTLVVQNDGAILIAGFGVFDRLWPDYPLPVLFRLRSDDSVDHQSGYRPTGRRLGLALEPSGKIIAYTFTGLTRLDSNGSLDTEFSAEFPDGGVRVVTAQGDGSILVGGEFTKVNGENRFGLARFRPIPIWRFSALSGNRDFRAVIGGQAGWNYQVEVSMDLKSWTHLRDLPSTGAVTQFIDVEMKNQRFYRVRRH